MYDASSNTLYRYTPPQEAKADGAHPAAGRAHPADASALRLGTTKSPAWRRSKKRSPTSKSTPTSPAPRPPTSPARPPTPCASPPRKRQPAGRRGALLGRRPRRAAARGDLLHRERRAGARTGRHLDLLRARRTVGVRIHAARQRQGRRSRAAQATDEHQALRRTRRRTRTPQRHHARQRARDDRRARKPRPRPAPVADLTRCPKGCSRSRSTASRASELPTELGTLLSFERSGVRYLLAGAVTPAAVEAVAKGL